MKRQSQTFAFIILFLGIALILFGFLIFIPFEKRDNVFWLDLAVTCLIFVNSINVFGRIGLFFDFNKQIASLGIRLVFIRFYGLLALLFMFYGWYNHIEFNYQLYIQLLGVLFLALTYFFSQLSSGKAMSVSAEQDNLRKGKEDSLLAIGEFEVLFSKDVSKWIYEKQKIGILKESIRYLSPSNNQTAFELDTEIANNIKKAYSLASTENDSKTEIIPLLNKCEELLKLRKNTYSN